MIRFKNPDITQLLLRSGKKSDDCCAASSIPSGLYMDQAFLSTERRCPCAKTKLFPLSTLPIRSAAPGLQQGCPC